MTRLLSLTMALMLALSLPLCAGAEDSRRWYENITKMDRIPAGDPERIAGDFSLIPAGNSPAAASAALAWAQSGIVHGLSLTPGGADPLSLFLTPDGGSWIITLLMARDSFMLTLDTQGRLISLQAQDDTLPAYDGYLPEGTDAAVLSCIEAYARMNGCSYVTDYERIGCTGTGDSYDVRITARARVDGTEGQFTLSLETMDFTAISCALPPVFDPQLLTMTTPVPGASMEETYVCQVNGQSMTVPALDHHRLGNAFVHVPENARGRAEVIAIALEALTAATGLPAEAFVQEPLHYGWCAESIMHYWQLDFSVLQDDGTSLGYTVHVRDCDGAVLGVWSPEEANG
ncbi:MAG: hypothetical protein IJ343_04050 [Clostridia bacterium]|nr:hypothetical protein [Clostridia bacterium]